VKKSISKRKNVECRENDFMTKVLIPGTEVLDRWEKEDQIRI
jgi:hypothetical protein